MTERRSWLRLLGPAFVAAMAYVDPGNVAANTTAGATYGYLLLWALVAASLMAMLVQYLSAKLGLVTGTSLAHHIADGLAASSHRRIGRAVFGGQALLVAIATDLAEVVGGAIALNLLFGLPLWFGGLVVGVTSTLLLHLLRQRGEVHFEAVLAVILGVIAVGFVSSLLWSPPDPAGAAAGLLPRFTDAGSIQLAAAMLGATVMPHAIYLHSALVTHRHGEPTAGRLPRLLRIQRYDVVLALVVAGSVNVAMLLFAAAGLQGHGIDSIEAAHARIGAGLGALPATLFAVGLLASGVGSSVVGTDAGASILEPLVGHRVGELGRRLLTVGPAVMILLAWPNPTQALVWSQLVLSFGIGFALVPLVVLTSRRRVMGVHVNRPWLRALAWLVTAAVLALNVAVVATALA